MSDYDREDIIIAISEILERGDQDQLPWAFYEHDHGGLKGYAWTKENADVERSNFIEAVLDHLEQGKAAEAFAERAVSGNG